VNLSEGLQAVIADIQKRRQWTQTDLANALGVSQAKVSMWLSGQRGRRALEPIEELARIAGTTPSELVRQMESYVLTCHDGTAESEPHPGGAVSDPQTEAQAREIAELRARLTEYEALISEMQDVAGRLFRLAADTRKESSARKSTESARGRRARKAG